MSLLIVYCVEAGVVLIVAPWTRYWDRNYFIEGWPVVEALATSPVLRGGITGLGVVTLGAALVETWRLARSWVVAADPLVHAAPAAASAPRGESASAELREEPCPPSS